MVALGSNYFAKVFVEFGDFIRLKIMNQNMSLFQKYLELELRKE
jgi:hypothetical protein